MSVQENYINRMGNARRAGGILFCGAGFSADCLSFNPDVTLGTGAQLLTLFKEVLTQQREQAGYTRLKNAASAVEPLLGEHGMLKLLRSKFQVQQVTEDMTDLLRFPWRTVYTTNYDNALEIAATKAGRAFDSWNNTDNPSETGPAMPIVHLHGFIHKWDIHNFKRSCILDAESYLALGSASSPVNPWLAHLRADIRDADFVAFVGFSADDLHISQAIFDQTGLREKAFFINRPSASADPDTHAEQSRLGTPLYIGRTQFAQDITEALGNDLPEEPRLQCLKKMPPAAAINEVPKAEEIEDLFMLGDVVEGLLVQDISSGSSDYHVNRRCLNEINDLIAGGKRVVLITGYPCDGKTIVADSIRVSQSLSRNIFVLKKNYEGLLDEVAAVIGYYKNVTVFIENCFDIRNDRLSAIAKLFDDSDSILILTSRTISSDAAVGGFQKLENYGSYAHYPIPRLSDDEVNGLVELVERFGGWHKFYTGSAASQRRFITDTCDRSLPHFLLRFLKSSYVRERYETAISSTLMDTDERVCIVTALFFAHLGSQVPVSLLSDGLKTDVGRTLDRLNENSGSRALRLVRRRGDFVESVPSIGASNILEHLFKDSEIVDCVLTMLRYLNALPNKDDFENHLFKQMLRYTHFSSILSSKEQIERFFNEVAKETYVKTMPLFWLQRHMAMVDHGNFDPAERYLDTGFLQAKEIERKTGFYNFTHLNDRKAKFLMQRIQAPGQTVTPAFLFRDFSEAIKLTQQIMSSDDPQHYPFETMLLISDAYVSASGDMDPDHRSVILNGLRSLLAKGTGKFDSVRKGFQTERARNSLAKTTKNLEPFAK